MKNILFVDTETTGLPVNPNAHYTNTENWPRVVQIAWQVYSGEKLIEEKCELVYPDGFNIPKGASKIHGITQKAAKMHGKGIETVISLLEGALFDCGLVVCHNVAFDRPTILAEYQRLLEKDEERWGGFWAMKTIETYCTKEQGADMCRIPNTSSRYPGQWKWPSLDELYLFLFNEAIPGREGFHGALVDVRATARCYFEMQKPLQSKKDAVVYCAWDMGREKVRIRDCVNTNEAKGRAMAYNERAIAKGEALLETYNAVGERVGNGTWAYVYSEWLRRDDFPI